MQTYELMVYERSVRASSHDTTLVRTSVGVDRIHVIFDNAEWLSFPVTVTFGNGDVVVTQAMQVTRVTDSPDWVAHGAAVIPHEVLRNVGPIRVTFQGTDSSGNHIITAAGSPLEVEEAGDVALGVIPGDAPTVDQWTQAYADAVAAANEAASIVSELRSQLDDMIASSIASITGASEDAIGELGRLIETSISPATRDSLGVVKVGSGLGVTDEGVISSESGLTESQRTAIRNLTALAMAVFGSNVESSVYDTNVIVDAGVLPIATVTSVGAVMPDGVTVRIDENGMIRCESSMVTIATTRTPGTVRPDGTTILVDVDGTIHADSGAGARFGYVGNSSYDTPALVVGDESDGAYTFPGLTTVVTSQFYSCSNIGAISMPECAEVLRNAFGTCTSLAAADFPVCIKIDDYAFFRCYALAAVSLPVCETIGNSAFEACTSLSTVLLPSCTSIGNYAFNSCSALVTASLPACTTIGSSAFKGCSALASISLPSCLRVSSCAFSGCRSMSAAYLPACTEVGYYAFNRCVTLTTAIMPSCSWIGGSAFEGCHALSEIDISNCRTLVSRAFALCSSLTSIYLPSCMTIYASAFAECVSLAEVSLPICTSIGDSAFTGCTSLVSLHLTSVSSVTQIGDNAFDSTPIGGYSATAGQYGYVYVPESLADSFRAASSWSSISERIVGV